MLLSLLEYLLFLHEIQEGKFQQGGIPPGAVGQQKWFWAISLAENVSCNVN